MPTTHSPIIIITLSLLIALPSTARILSKEDAPTTTPKYQYYLQTISYIGDEIEHNQIQANDGKGPYSFCLIKFLVKSDEFRKKSHENKHGDQEGFSDTDYVFIKKLVNGSLCSDWKVELPEGERILESQDDEQRTINFDSGEYYQLEIDVVGKVASFLK